MEEIKIGISACLTGQQVRFDKSHKRSNFCMDDLSKFVKYVPFCPEVAVGLPVPRPTIRQIQAGDVIKVSRPDGSMDVAEALQEYGKKIAQQSDDLSGFVFCAKSPSGGMERVKVYSEEGNLLNNDGIGTFAREIMKHNPLLPCEENGRLNDVLIKENFVIRVLVYSEWKALAKSGITKHKLFQFHAKHKYLLMAHNPVVYKDLGRFLGQAESSAEAIASEYITGLMTGLQKKATRKTHCNTMQHLLGYFKKELSKEQKQEMLEQIDGYREGLLPLMAPLTLFKHYLREFPKPYLQGQSYFEPYPAELRIRYGY
jgi:uncharacterized protein YbgA (DUF1722 family)/uncharacterized protein YbbK (DUF523 family)